MIIVYLPFGNFYFPSFSSSEMQSFHLIFFFNSPLPHCHLRGKPVGKRGAARGNVTFGSAANPQASERASTHELTRGLSSAAVEHMVTSRKCGGLAWTRGCLGDRRGLTMVCAFILPLSPALPTCDKSHTVAMFISTPSGVCADA